MWCAAGGRAFLWSEIFITNAVIAWTYLAHAYFLSKAVAYWYEDPHWADTSGVKNAVRLIKVRRESSHEAGWLNDCQSSKELCA